MHAWKTTGSFHSSITRTGRCYSYPRIYGPSWQMYTYIEGCILFVDQFWWAGSYPVLLWATTWLQAHHSPSISSIVAHVTRCEEAAALSLLGTETLCRRGNSLTLHHRAFSQPGRLTSPRQCFAQQRKDCCTGK